MDLRGSMTISRAFFRRAAEWNSWRASLMEHREVRGETGLEVSNIVLRGFSEFVNPEKMKDIG